jgi:AP-4 complex subunit mu-1
VATTHVNASPLLILELISCLMRVIKDYCGVLTEESIRKNFLLIYELLDECIDYGFAQVGCLAFYFKLITNVPIS